MVNIHERTPVMKQNIGSIDRFIRIAIGIALLALVLVRCRAVSCITSECATSVLVRQRLTLMDVHCG